MPRNSSPRRPRRGRRKGRAGRLRRAPGTAEVLALLLDPARVLRQHLPPALRGYSVLPGSSPFGGLSISFSGGYRATLSSLLPLSNVTSTDTGSPLPSAPLPGLPEVPSDSSGLPVLPTPSPSPPRLRDPPPGLYLDQL